MNKLAQNEEVYPGEVRFNWKVAVVTAIAGAVGAFMVYWVTTTLR